jgi:glutamyl-tRNA reductase
MSIQMVGIDHNKASIELREIFSFTKKQSTEVMRELKEYEEVLGCVILSTCNRMEVWISTKEGKIPFICEKLCEIKGVPYEKYKKYFTQRQELEAIWHLFELSCGLKSMILGEDQIITQVKDSLALARDDYMTDKVLEVLFRMAVTAAKKVKTKISLSSANTSVIHHAIQMLEREGYSFHNKKCMVIGNGEMGKVAATALRSIGADVTVTVRQYKSGIVYIPEGCRRINYGDRMEYFPICDLVVSATSSPNCTIKKQEVESLQLMHPMTLIDLAVPRDMDPEVRQLEGITLYDIDYFRGNHLDEETNSIIIKAKEILREKIEEFLDWYECLDVIPRIQTISQLAAEDLEVRVHKSIQKLSVEEKEKFWIQERLEASTLKMMNKLLFGLKDSVNEDVFREMIAGMEKLYGKDAEGKEHLYGE